MNYQADCRVQEIPAVWFFLAVFVPFPTRKSLKKAKSIITEHRKNQNKKIYNYLLSLLLIHFLSWGLLSQYRISIILLKKWWEKQKPMKINNNFLTIFEALCVPLLYCLIWKGAVKASDLRSTHNSEIYQFRVENSWKLTNFQKLTLCCSWKDILNF